MWNIVGKHGWVLGVAASIVVFTGTGCENDGASRGGGASFVGTDIVQVPVSPGSSGSAADNEVGGNRFVGSWALYEGTAAQGTPTWYVHFKSDNTFFISDESNGGGVRVTGTYTVSGGSLVGPFTNPGTGTGRVEATIHGNVIQLDFIEYWHSPHKVIHYAGLKS